MSFIVTATVASAVVGVVGVGHSIETSNQQGRIAGQKKNEANAIAAKQEADLKKQEQVEAATKERDLSRLNMRRRSMAPGMGAPGLGIGGNPQGLPVAPGQGTTIGS